MIDNRIVNGGFENSTVSVSPFSGSNVTIITTNSHSGSNSARFVGGTSSATLSQLVPVSPGENFEFLVSLAKIGSNTSPPIDIFISYRDSNNNAIPNALTTTIHIPSGRLPNNNEDDWIEIYRTTTVAPAAATQALVEIIKRGLSNSAPVVVDDVALLAFTGSGTDPSGDLTVGGNGTIQGDLAVGGNETIQGNLTVNGTTKLGNEISDRVRVIGNLETLSNTSFLGPVNEFTGSIFVANNITVGSEIIGSGNIQAFTIDLFGSDTTTETLKVRFGNIEIFGAGNGIILRAPNDTRWLLTVDNNGTITTTPAG